MSRMYHMVGWSNQIIPALKRAYILKRCINLRNTSLSTLVVISLHQSGLLQGHAFKDSSILIFATYFASEAEMEIRIRVTIHSYLKLVCELLMLKCKHLPRDNFSVSYIWLWIKLLQYQKMCTGTSVKDPPPSVKDG